jgi:hypothetical protein
MLKEYDPPKESAFEIAKPKWRNNAVSQRFKEAKENKVHLVEKREPVIADIIKNEGKRDGSLNRMETRVKKYIRTMLHGHADENLGHYAASLQHQKRRLLLEKLRRLEAKQARVAQPVQQPKRDLFS